jgi:hypothetical protein
MKSRYTPEQETRGCNKGCFFFDRKKKEYCGYETIYHMKLQFGKLGDCKCRRKITGGR